ncbi:hypothetical protein [Proteiniphilum sp.]|uniref:hypothetical protein n=1 Tax=Proteiniphilum sp. TaxID=1926877 RepID=UPI002B1F0B63|nr:hypothetical protein [Proteiniphilum sp.]MEA4916319.1 hypothetical protein [Proteiniphilum sp.]
MENKSKSKKGCLLVFLVFSVIIIIISLFSNNEDSNDPISQTNLQEDKQEVVDSALIKLQDSLRAETKKKIDSEITKFTTNYDDIEGVTWIYSKSKPYYANTKAFYNYIGMRDNGQVWKRLVIRYHGDDWLFINKIIIKTDEQTYTLDASNSKRDNNTEVWEWIDIEEGTAEFIIINDIINSKQTKVRFVGDQYHFDWILPKKTVTGLKEIEDFYYLLNSYYVSGK